MDRRIRIEKRRNKIIGSRRRRKSYFLEERNRDQATAFVRIPTAMVWCRTLLFPRKPSGSLLHGSVLRPISSQILSIPRHLSLRRSHRPQERQRLKATPRTREKPWSWASIYRRLEPEGARGEVGERPSGTQPSSGLLFCFLNFIFFLKKNSLSTLWIDRYVSLIHSRRNKRYNGGNGSSREGLD